MFYKSLSKFEDAIGCNSNTSISLSIDGKNNLAITFETRHNSDSSTTIKLFCVNPDQLDKISNLFKDAANWLEANYTT